MALFSEKYGDVVRVIRVGPPGEPPYSAELCGGTHVRATGEIGSAVLLSDSAVAAGVRRLEVVTGRGALQVGSARAAELAAIAQALNAPLDQVAAQAARLTQELGETRKSLESAQRDLSRARFEAILSKAETRGGAAVLVAQVEAATPDMLREMSDWFRERQPSGVLTLGAAIGEKPAIVVAVSADLNKRGLDAGKIIREVAGIVGGGGGGRPTFAQGSGKDSRKLADALARANEIISRALSV